MITCLLLASGTTYALQPLDDHSMSQATGQDGLTVTLQDFEPNAQIIWSDNDGLSPANFGVTAPETGAVIFGDGTSSGNFRMSKGTTFIKMDADANSGSPFLNVNIELPSDLTINTGDVHVAGKDVNGNLIDKTKIMNDMTIKLGGLNLNMQLGNAPLGAMFLITGVIQSGIQVSNIALIGDTTAGTDYGIGIGELVIRDGSGGSNLTFNGLQVNVVSAGLRLTPSAGKVVDVLMSDLRLGGIASGDPQIGGFAMLGLKLGGTSLTISGH